RFCAIDLTCLGLDLRNASTCECQHAEVHLTRLNICMDVPNSVWVFRCSAPYDVALWCRTNSDQRNINCMTRRQKDNLSLLRKAIFQGGEVKRTGMARSAKTVCDLRLFFSLTPAVSHAFLVA
ncbi:unnamed protein product, partial [Ectocarpus sp. 8 AP-2014]